MNIKTFFGRVFSFRNAKTAALALGGIAVFLFTVSYGLSWYGQWKGRQGVENLAEMLKKIEAEDYKLAMADTYGGKTPQETLQMYIDAVEKGDFELASRYLILDEREKELKGLLNIKDDKQFLSQYLEDLKKAVPDGEVIDNTFRMKSKISSGPYYFIRFMKYPNNIWKITDI